jgi:alkylresorcinol/alkylpyrone synthase
MPQIVAAAHALPRHEISQQEVKELIAEVFKDQVEDLEQHLRVFDNARIKTRQLVMPPEWYMLEHSPVEQNQVYLDEGMQLTREAAERCLHQANLSSADIDLVIFVSSTGHATPTLDARLIDALGFSSSTTRLPIWGLGCAAGAAALSRAYDYCRAYPEARALLIAMECCSLTFRKDDLSQKNLVGTALFSDGAAAAIVAGDKTGDDGPHILATRSHLFSDTARIMGWDFDDGGMQLVLSPKLPLLVRQELPKLVEDFLKNQGLKPQDIIHYVTHPGGARVIDAYRESLGLQQKDLRLTEKILRENGNISSVSVLMVLEEWLASSPAQKPGYGLISAFGPGFSAELLLLEV